jgi:hypothetical protein
MKTTAAGCEDICNGGVVTNKNPYYLTSLFAFNFMRDIIYK